MVRPGALSGAAPCGSAGRLSGTKDSPSGQRTSKGGSSRSASAATLVSSPHARAAKPLVGEAVQELFRTGLTSPVRALQYLASTSERDISPNGTGSASPKPA